MKLLPLSLLSLALTTATSPADALAADVSYFGIIKSQTYWQATNGSPTIQASNGYTFTALVLAATNNAVLGASVKPPNPTPSRTLSNGLAQTLWQFVAASNASAALDALYPGGTASYTMTLQTANDGVKTANLSFFLISAPPTPQLANLAAAQAVDAAADFLLQWASLGGSALDIVQLTLLDRASNMVFATPAPLQTGALNGASTSVLIPAHTLAPGADFTGYLTIGRPGLPSTSYATGIAALARTTSFALRSRPLTPPVLTNLVVAGSEIRFRLNGESNVNYQILGSTNLVNWNVLLTTNSATGVIDFTDPRSPGTARGFYRARGVQ